MIGVLVNPEHHAIVCEFFELFKTPWEFYRSGRQYDVLISDKSSDWDEAAARLVVIYDGRAEPDSAGPRDNGRNLAYGEMRIPIYGDCVTFRHEVPAFLVDAESRQAAAYVDRSTAPVWVRVGYDLFREAALLLTKGQPVANAGVPALDLHIAVLRDLITSNGVPLIEILPAPTGFRFTACLTHDVDHPSIRKHQFDHTSFGFLYRATVRSLLQTIRGRMPVRSLLKNWSAALKLPFVYLRLAEDFWLTFTRYTKVEKGVPSSFFVIPFRGYPGRSEDGAAPGPRASGYGAAEIDSQIQELMTAGCEVGLHGIDAWLDSAAGTREFEELRRITGAREIGVRMHWLYFADHSPLTLEQAGADYDSTVGYNGTIGYRAGTSQAYKPLDVTRLIELPLHIMDTALFYPSHLNLSEREAGERVSGILDHAVRSGGAITINWHDRSIAPERCWGEFYVRLIDELRSRGACFATAAGAVAWFRKRRAAKFVDVNWDVGAIRARIALDGSFSVADLQLRVHYGPESHQDLALQPGEDGRVFTYATTPVYRAANASKDGAARQAPAPHALAVFETTCEGSSRSGKV